MVVAGDTVAEKRSLLADTLALLAALNLHHLGVELTQALRHVGVQHGVVGWAASRRAHVLQQGAANLAVYINILGSVVRRTNLGQCLAIFTDSILQQVCPLIVESQQPAEITLTSQSVTAQVDEAFPLPRLYIALNV